MGEAKKQDQGQALGPAKWTPRPWAASTMTMDAYEWQLLNDGGELNIVKRGQDVIAAVWCGNDRDGEESANARLISLAPELAEALRQVSDHLHELCKDERDDPSVGIFGWDECHRAVGEARALLAKLEA